MNAPKSLAAAATIIIAGLLGCVYAVAVAVADEGARIEVTSGEFKTPVVELYTSEGCSSCPPADDWLRKLGASRNRDFNAVLLAFHVDYWNYLGWPDPYSKPAFTARQRELAANNRRRSIYTPAFMVDGIEARGGTRVVRAIQHANSQQAEATIALSVVRGDGNRIHARIAVADGANSDSDSTQTYTAHLAVYESGITRQIGGGENHGRTLKHDFVVRHWSAPITVRRGDTNAPATVDLEIPADWNAPNLGLAVTLYKRKRGVFESVQAVHTPLAALFPI